MSDHADPVEASEGSCVLKTESENCIVRLYKGCCPGISSGRCRSIDVDETINDVFFPWNFLWGKALCPGGALSQDQSEREMNQRIFKQIEEMERAAGLR